jgi:hypothetical protein
VTVPATSADSGPSAAPRTPDASERAEKSLSALARAGLAGRTGFYLILTALTVRIAVLGGRSGQQANAHGAMGIVSRPLIGKVAIGAVALGFALFGAGRILGALKDDSVSVGRRLLTAVQGLFYFVLAYVPSAFLAGNSATGSQQQQNKTTAEVLGLPGGRVWLALAGVVFIGVCLQQIRGALGRDFADGLELDGSPRAIRNVARASGVVGITSRALVFLPVGVFLIVAAWEVNPRRSYGTDSELLALSGSWWGVLVLVAVALGLGVFVVFSAIETRYRSVISAK